MGEKNHYEKATLWENSTFTPLAIRLPRRQHAGVECQRQVNSIDFLPTLCDYCSLQEPQHTSDGQSLRPLLTNPDVPWGHPSLTCYGDGLFSVCSERFRSIQYPDGSEELYDHSIDPHEFTNVAIKPEHEQTKNGLRKAIPTSYAKSLGGRNGEARTRPEISYRFPFPLHRPAERE